METEGSEGVQGLVYKTSSKPAWVIWTADEGDVIKPGVFAHPNHVYTQETEAGRVATSYRITGSECRVYQSCTASLFLNVS